ncbi:hypothetical protein ACFZBE_17960 [Streptomyces sp. NPDC008061]
MTVFGSGDLGVADQEARRTIKRAAQAAEAAEKARAQREQLEAKRR